MMKFTNQVSLSDDIRVIEGAVIARRESGWMTTIMFHSSYNELHYSAFRPGANSEHFENCFWYVMEIEQIELDIANWVCWAILMENCVIALDAVNYQLKALKCHRAKLSIAQRTSVSVDQKLTRHEAFACNWVLVQIIHWLSIMTIWLLKQHGNSPIVTMSVNRASMNFGYVSNLIGRWFACCYS